MPSPGLRTLVAAVALATVGALTTSACAEASTPSTAPSAPSAASSADQPARRAPRVRVLAISVDGLSSQAIRRLGKAGTPAFHRLRTHGAGTLNARPERELTITLPNHTGMLTGRRVDARHGGHGVTWNTDRPGTTVQGAAGHPVASIFSRVHSAGGRTALFAAKDKFSLFDRSWPIDRFHVDADNTRLTTTAIRDLRSHRRAFTFLHLSLPDKAGHAYGGMSPQYRSAVHAADAQVGRVLRAVHGNARLRRQTRVILTADHGFARGHHSHSEHRLNDYRIPFLVWGRSIHHARLYRMNPDFRFPGHREPGYRGRQPIRNGMVANLAADFLDLRSVPGSEFNRRQRLDVHRR